MKRALVTGGSGFIASHLVERLFSEGWMVGITARYANPVKCPRLAGMWDNLYVYEADVRNRGALDRVARDQSWDVVYHLAAYNHVGTSWDQVEECYDVNAKGSANVFEAFRGRRIVYMSSSEIYGRQHKIPINESQPPMPASPYAVTKYAGELQAGILAERGDDIAIARSFNVYGPEQSTKALIPALIERLKRGLPVFRSGSGKQTRDYLYVTDAVAGLIAIAKRGKPGRPYNLCTSKQVSIKYLIGKIAGLLATQPEVAVTPKRPNELMRLAGSYLRSKRELNWRPTMDINGGLEWVVSASTGATFTR